jgi:Brp/Blh family beta-carotene 15,15'-monooxygenase
MESELKLLNRLRQISRIGILFGILVGFFHLATGGIPIEAQVVLALIALAVGIPHGAVDHLVTVPKMASLRMAIFLTGYLAVVGLAIWFILSANLLGFQLVVLMSAIHFGIGDAAFISEIDSRSNKSRFPKLPYALAAGFTPVMIPLVNQQSAEALAAVNPDLIGWAGVFESYLYFGMIAIALIAFVWMIVIKRFDNALDIGLLLVISLTAPPLIAFAFYFGLWHALRHTGRLSLELPSSVRAHESKQTLKAFWASVTAGLPALVLVIVFTIGLGLTIGLNLSSELLWILLVVIWALTVPHMALTARLDVRALR